MANDFDAILGRLVARTLPVLRQSAIMPRLVTRMPEFNAGGFGSTVDVPMSSAVTVSDVTPGYAPTAPTNDMAPSFIQVTVDQWKEASFGLSDKEILEIGNSADYLPRQVEQAIKSLANNVDTFIYTALKKGVPYSAGTAGTTPFDTDVRAYTDARKVLNRNLAPMDGRNVVIDVDAEANAINLRAFQDASWRGNGQVMATGQLGPALGANWFSTQNIPTHTFSSATGYQSAAAALAGAGSVAIDTGTGTYAAGDVIKFAADSEPYAVISHAAGILSVAPNFRVNIPDNNAITNQFTGGGSAVLNWLIHPDVFAFASRPLQTPEGFGVQFKNVVDPVTGLAFRLEVERQHKQIKWSFDILFGGRVVIPEFGVRIYG